MIFQFDDGKSNYTAMVRAGEINYRVMCREDASAIFQKGRALDSIRILPWETVRLLSLAIERNPNLSQVALNRRGTIVGFLFGGHDGLRGGFHHLWVDEEYRRNGIASNLVNRSINEFMSIRPAIKRMRIMVLNDTEGAVEFWRKIGFSESSALGGQIVSMFMDLEIESDGEESLAASQPVLTVAPSSWQTAVINWVWTSRHRNKIVAMMALAFVIGSIWTAATGSIPENSIAGKILPWKKAVVVPVAKDNNSSYFSVPFRRDFVDLDTYRDVSEAYKGYNVSPTIRETEIRLVKKNQNMDYFYNLSKTSGSAHDIVCLSGQPFSVYPVSTFRMPGGRIHNDYEMAINLSDLKTGASANLRWQTVSWNKFQGEDNWWASVIAAYDVEDMDFTIDFPTSAGMTIGNVKFKKRVISAGSFQTLDSSSQNAQINPQTGEITWKMKSVKGGYEYAIFWDKNLTTADE